jgi:proteasome lid subunit RPN8/RPN11
VVDIVLRYPDPFDPSVCEAIRQHALAEYPKESCGLVVEEDGGVRYLPCENIAADPTKEFEIASDITLKWMQRVALKACVHSHPDGPAHPSFKDEAQQIASGVPWGIVPILAINRTDPQPTEEDPTPVGEWNDKPMLSACDIVWWGDQLPRVPLENRKFVWCIFDCWALVRDFYLQEAGIVLYEVPCHENFVDRGDNMFLTNVENAGLRNLGKISMSELRRGDILLGHLRGEHPSHAGVYLGGDDFLHHPPRSVSGVANLLRWWPHIDTVLRHDGFDEAASLRAAG